MQHKWNHDQTADGTYNPLVCDGIYEPDASVGLCMKCRRAADAHGLPVNDHTKCIMTCEVCGEKWQCNKIYPDNKECAGQKEINQ